MTKKTTIKFFILLGCLYFLFLISKGLANSPFFQKKDRLNIVFNQDKHVFYSLGLTDKVNYFISFYPDLEVSIPGGYGYYRLGGVTKLALLEKDPDIIKRTYSMATSSVIDYYFYPPGSSDKTSILFGKDKQTFFLPTLSMIFFDQSNANFFERFFIYLKFFGKSKSQFKIINFLPMEEKTNRTVFSTNDLFKNYQGIFYKRTYRNERLSVQIVYTKSYKTAMQLGQILEGEGIRVVDLTQSNENKKNCEIVENAKKFSETSRSLGHFFGCQLLVGETGVYDIILKLNETEKKWEVD